MMQTVIELISLREDLLSLCKEQKQQISRLEAECLANKTNMEEARDRERDIAQRHNELQHIIAEKNKLIDEYRETFTKAVEVIQNYKKSYSELLKINNELLDMNNKLRERIKELKDETFG